MSAIGRLPIRTPRPAAPSRRGYPVRNRDRRDCARSIPDSAMRTDVVNLLPATMVNRDHAGGQGRTKNETVARRAGHTAGVGVSIERARLIEQIRANKRALVLTQRGRSAASFWTEPSTIGSLKSWSCSGMSSRRTRRSRQAKGCPRKEPAKRYLASGGQDARYNLTAVPSVETEVAIRRQDDRIGKRFGHSYE